MAIKINTNKGLGILFCISIFFISCNNKDKLIGEYYLTNEMKQTVPFDGSEIIYFIDGVDTIVLDQGKRNNFIRTIYISPTEFTYGEESNTKFSTENSYLFTRYDLQSNYYYNPGRFIIEWYERENAGGLINEGSFFFKLPLSTTTLEQGQWFLDEMEVRGVNYTNVYCDSVSFNGGYTWPNEPKTVYYTEEAGIIKIEFSQGNTWELLKIDWD